MSEQLEARVALLEAEVALLKSSLEGGSLPGIDSQPWWEEIAGTFADDPMYDEAMQLGKKYRDSLCLEDDESKSRKFPKISMSPVSHDALSPKDSKAHKG
ncbi:MAG: hypothetical protein ACR2FS_18960 [Phormidesmis sp.]